MVNYIIRRLFLIPLILFCVTVLIFGMLQFLSPVERSALYVRDIPKNERALDGIIKRYGLDQPIPVQYWKWLVGTTDPRTDEIRGGILRGDFGYSRTASEPIADLIKRRFPATMDSLLNGRFDIFIDTARHMFLPVITLSYLWWALQMRITRSSMLETLRQDYITTARSKGVSERTLIFRHALPNALMPVVTLGGGTVIGLLSGVVIVETVFDYHGMGSAFAEAATNLDVVTVLAFTLINGLIMIFTYIIVDVLYAYIDPRVRLD